MQVTHWPRWALSAGVRSYRLLLKPWLGNVCRFEPSCSAYALEALGKHGAVGGVALSAARILRCHPWCYGGLDPVPDDLHLSGRRFFTRLLAGTAQAKPAPDLADPPPLFRKLP